MKEQKKNLKSLCSDGGWTLFLDRDGIINEKIEDDYVRKWEQLEFKPGFLENIAGLCKLFKYTLIVTNQRCIAKKFITEAELELIHKKMLGEITKAGGKISAIYHCPHNNEDDCACRKPKTGMAIRAKDDFKDIDFSKSLMVGDSESDTEFGKELGMVTVLISKGSKSQETSDADYTFSDISSLHEALVK